VLRKLFIVGKLSIVAALAAIFAAPAGADIVQKSLLMPGVSYTRQVQFTPHGPVVLHVLTMPKPDGTVYALRPVLSQGAIVGRARVTEMEKPLSPVTTVAGVNGDLFSVGDAHPSGVLMRSGVLETPPLADRSSIGIGQDGTLHVDRIQFSGAWRGTGQRRPLRLNQPPAAGTNTLYTQTWGPTTPPNAGDAEAVIVPMGPTRPNVDLTGQVLQLASGGNTPIPPGGAVLVGTGGQAGKVSGEAPVGTTVTVRLTLTPSWDGITDALGGGPAIVKDGRAVFRAYEGFSTAQLTPRDARTAVGQMADGRIILLVVDGRRFGYSVGVTNFELAITMARLGAVTASALDAGDSTTMAFEGKLINRPSDPSGERPVSDALMLMYYGVYAGPPAETVLSPNGDGVSDAQTFTYKTVRPATVTATLTAPDKTTRTLSQTTEQPGAHTLAWPGTGEPEGSWRFSVTAADDQGRTTTADRVFALNSTLGYVKADGGRIAQAGGRALAGSFTLAHPAKVSASIVTAAGATVRTLMVDRSLEAGEQSVAWDGRTSTGKLAFGGAYALRVEAANQIGRVVQSASFAARR
jgi:hypothetical protein